MKYEITIWYPHNDDWDCLSESFDDLQDCIDYFDRLQDCIEYFDREVVYFRQMLNVCSVKINGRKIDCSRGYLADKDGNPISTNQAFHDVFADYEYPRIQQLRAPTNPATLQAMGKL